MSTVDRKGKSIGVVAIVDKVDDVLRSQTCRPWG